MVWFNYTRDESILLFFPPIFLSSNSGFADLFCSIFCSKDPNFAHTFPSSQTIMTALLEYFVCSLSLVTVLLEYLDFYNDNKIVLDCSIKIIRSFLFLMC